MSSSPIDHLPATLRDRDCIRLEEAIERRKALFRQARSVSAALRSITERQPQGQLTRAEGAILSQMLLQNLRACVRQERHYRPTRALLAKRTGYSERTVSKAIGRFKDLGLVVAQRYAKGGRLGDKGKGLATEFRSGCLQFLCDQLKALGYRLPKSLRCDLEDLARWAALQVGQQPTAQQSDPRSKPEPTGKQVPGTMLGQVKRAARNGPNPAPVATVQAEPTRKKGEPPLRPGPHAFLSKESNSSSPRPGRIGRAPLSPLALAASGMVPMPGNHVVGRARGAGSCFYTHGGSDG